jgi:hypothetical protein
MLLRLNWVVVLDWAQYEQTTETVYFNYVLTTNYSSAAPTSVTTEAAWPHGALRLQDSLLSKSTTLPSVIDGVDR